MADKKPAATDTAGKSRRKTKAEIYKALADATKLTKTQVSEVFDQLTKLLLKELGKKGPGEFVIPGLLKLKTKRVAATKARMGPNPFKPGEQMKIAAKPARSVVRARALKVLNDG